MRTQQIKTSEDGYNALLSELFSSYDINKNVINFNYNEEMPIIPLTTLEDKQTFINCLFEFKLDKNTIDIIYKRYGVTDGNANTLKALGTEYDLTDEGVRTIIRKGIRQAKHPLNVKRAIDRWFRGV